MVKGSNYLTKPTLIVKALVARVAIRNDIRHAIRSQPIEAHIKVDDRAFPNISGVSSIGDCSGL